MKRITGLSEEVTDLDGNVILENQRPELVDGVPVLENGRPKMAGDPLTVKRALAVMIARAKSPDPVRMMDIAHRMQHADGEIEVDDADVDALVKLVKEDRGYTNLVCAAVLSSLNGEAQDQAS